MMLSQSTLEVSVIIPVYNEEKYIKNCIHSLIAQSYPLDKMEWIIVDGASTDSTKSIVKGFEDSYPIVLLDNKERKTPISMNIGIKSSRGKYIIRLDAHASFPNDYIEKCVYYLENTDADNVGGFVETKANGFVGSAIAIMLSSKFGVGGSSFRIGDKSGYVDTVPFGAFRREIFGKVGLFNENLLRSEDNDMNARIRQAGGKIYLAEDIISTYYCRDTVKGLLRMALQNGNALFWTLREDLHAMSIRHFIPFAFLISLIIMPVVFLTGTTIKWLFVLELIAYCMLDCYYSFKPENRKYGVITLWLFPLFHVFYGIGSLLGLMRIKMY